MLSKHFNFLIFSTLCIKLSDKRLQICQPVQQCSMWSADMHALQNYPMQAKLQFHWPVSGWQYRWLWLLHIDPGTPAAPFSHLHISVRVIKSSWVVTWKKTRNQPERKLTLMKEKRVSLPGFIPSNRPALQHYKGSTTGAGRRAGSHRSPSWQWYREPGSERGRHHAAQPAPGLALRFAQLLVYDSSNSNLHMPI